MGNLHLKAIPDELIRKMKIIAAGNGVTLKAECLEIIRRHCGIIDSDSFRKTGKVDHVDRGGSGSASGDAPRRIRNRTPVPDVRKASGDAERLHPVQPMRNELVDVDVVPEGGGHHPEPEDRTIRGDVAHAGHKVFRAGIQKYCSDCKVMFDAD